MISDLIRNKNKKAVLVDRYTGFFVLSFPFLNVSLESSLNFHLMLSGGLGHLLNLLHVFGYFFHLALVFLVDLLFLLFLLSFILFFLDLLSEVPLLDFSLFVSSLLDGGEAHLLAVWDEDQLVLELVALLGNFIDSVIASSLELQEAIYIAYILLWLSSLTPLST